MNISLVKVEENIFVAIEHDRSADEYLAARRWNKTALSPENNLGIVVYPHLSRITSQSRQRYTEEQDGFVAREQDRALNMTS